jgi:hypothetical protein
MKYFFSLFFLLSAPAFSEIYKWTDAEGNVHFGDNPNNKEQATELKINTDARSGVTHSSGRNKYRDLLLKQSAEARAEKAEKKKEYQAKRKKMKRRCSLARDHLKRHMRASGIYKINPKGERQYYSNKERAKSEKRLRRSIKKYCR